MTTREHEDETGGEPPVVEPKPEETVSPDTEVPTLAEAVESPTEAEEAEAASPEPEPSVGPAFASAASPEEPYRPAEPRRRGSLFARVLAIAIIALIAIAAGAALYRGYGERFWPSDQIRSLEQRVAALDGGNRQAGERLTAVSSDVAGVKTRIASLASRVEDTGTTATAATNSVRNIDRRL